MSHGGFKSLLVWQKAQHLSVRVYQVTRADAFSREFSLVDQMRRAAVSIASNIAEGDERDTDKDAVRFFFIAKGSTAELRSQLDLATKVNLLPNLEFGELEFVFRFFVDRLVGKFEDRPYIGAQVGIMKKSVFFKTHFHKSSIESGYQFLNFSQVQIAHSKAGVSFFAVQLHQFLIFQQGNFYALRYRIYN